MDSSTSFARSLAIQGRVLYAMLMREVITRFGRENLGVLWLIAEPMTFTLGVTTLWSLAGLGHVSGSGLPITAFAISGYSSVLLWRNTVSRCSCGIQQNFNLLYHRNVRVIDVFLTRIAIDEAGATASFMVLSLFFTSIGWMDLPVDLGMVLVGWLMLAWFGASLAILIGAATAYSEIVDRIWHPTAYLLFPLSGAAFLVDWLSPGAQKVILFVPMVHGVEMVRAGFFGPAVHTHYSVAYLGTVNLVLTLVGLFVLRDAGRRAVAP